MANDQVIRIAGIDPDGMDVGSACEDGSLLSRKEPLKGLAAITGYGELGPTNVYVIRARRIDLNSPEVGASPKELQLPAPSPMFTPILGPIHGNGAGPLAP